jgi:hypothetical protein
MDDGDEEKGEALGGRVEEVVRVSGWKGKA